MTKKPAFSSKKDELPTVPYQLRRKAKQQEPQHKLNSDENSEELVKVRREEQSDFHRLQSGVTNCYEWSKRKIEEERDKRYEE